jgi:hypothetical protein
LKTIKKYTFLLISLGCFISCNSRPDDAFILSQTTPHIEPRYSGITIPPNIAPLNFIIGEEGKSFYIRITAGEDEIEISSE